MNYGQLLNEYESSSKPLLDPEFLKDKPRELEKYEERVRHLDKLLNMEREKRVRESTFTNKKKPLCEYQLDRR